MSAPGKGHESRSHAGTAGAPNSAPGAATGQVRSYGMGQGQAGYPSGSATPAPGQVPQAYGYAPQGYGQTPGSYGQGAQAPYGAQGYYGQAGQAGYAGQPFGQAYAGQAAYQAPATSQPQTLKKKRKWPIIVAILVALVCIAIAILLALTMCDGGSSRRQGDAGQLKGKSEAEIQAELDRVVEEGMFNISIASVIEFDSGTSEGELRIENVPGNRYLMRVTLVRNDTGEEIYQTDVIEPNHHIQADALDVALPQGSYECTALFEALDPETEEQVGNAAAIVTVNVKS